MTDVQGILASEVAHLKSETKKSLGIGTSVTGFSGDRQYLTLESFSELPPEPALPCEQQPGRLPLASLVSPVVARLLARAVKELC